MDGERTRLATFHSRPAGKPPRKVLADIHAQNVVRCWALKGGPETTKKLQNSINKKRKNKSGCCPCKRCANSALLPSFLPGDSVAPLRKRADLEQCWAAHLFDSLSHFGAGDAIPPPEASGFYSTLLCPRRSERERERGSRVPSCCELNSPHGQTAGLVAHTRRSAPVCLAMDARRACLRPSENCTFLGRLRQSRFQAALAGRTEPSYGTTPTHIVLPGIGSCSP